MSGDCEKSLGLLPNVLREKAELLDSEHETLPLAPATGSPLIRRGEAQHISDISEMYKNIF